MKKYSIILFFIASFILSGCDKFLDVNKDPNNLTPSEEGTLDAMLPALEMQWIYTGNGADNLKPMLFSLQVGIIGTWGDDDRISYLADQGVYLWDYYNNGLKNADYLYKAADKIGKKYYMGLAQVIMAWHYATIVDYLDKAPMSEALQYPEILNPKFDEGSQIYANIFTMLDEAIANLSESGQYITAGADLIYGGDASKWIKTANLLKARYAIRLSYAPGKSKSGQADIALAALSNSFGSAADEPKITFGSASNSWSWYHEQTYINPWIPSIFMLGLMKDLEDPRIPAYFIPNSQGNYFTTKYCTTGEAEGTYSQVNPVYVAANSSIYVSTLAEMKFLQAEAYVFKANWTAAQAAFEAGIRASMTANAITGTVVDDYIAQFLPFPQTEEAAQELVITQKYLALYCRTAEPWFDYLRTGYPALDWAGSINDPVNSHPPYRYMYPTEVRTDDPNCPAGVIDPAVDKVFWDAK
jgi:hypothetical protein